MIRGSRSRAINSSTDGMFESSFSAPACNRGCRILHARGRTFVCRLCAGYDCSSSHKDRWAPALDRLVSLRRRIKLGHPLHGWSKRRLRNAMLAYERDVAESRSESHCHSFPMELAFNKRQVVDMTASLDSMISSLTMREPVRDAYSTRRDPIVKDRLQWRAQSFRHITHLLPRQTILELGCGDAIFTRCLVDTTRNERAITAVTFTPGAPRPINLPESVEFVPLSQVLDPQTGRKFDFVIAHDMLDRQSGFLGFNPDLRFVSSGWSSSVL
jgi:hypothetical protein